MTATRLIGHIASAALVTTAAALVPVAAGAATMPVVAASSLNLTVTGQPGTAQFRSAVLTCEPTGGTHPNAPAACDNLTGVNGDFQELTKEPAPAMCTLDLKKVTLRATGTWRGKSVNFEREFANVCVAKSHTGEVFSF
ncbi:protease inhibitor [Saccharopolyspora erythraea]|uniref:subtilase-type protease inhibitor n=1 Tax=Saccharopolyspora erythraea TaxID=1836 RepID=UPI001BA7333A|nr:subtilase-type protease inhibitor [Saccharopolyspora erythraea]QUH04777.1 protease inhibitor [Saccharopolyspora erythraea]